MSKRKLIPTSSIYRCGEMREAMEEDCKKKYQFFQNIDDKSTIFWAIF